MKGQYTHYYDDLPLIARILLQIFLGGLIGGIYRIIRFVESKNVVTLVAGILTLFTGVGNLIAWIVDLVTTCLGKGISVLAD